MHTGRVTRPPGARPRQDRAAAKLLVPAAQGSEEGPQVAAGELLRRLAGRVLEAGDPTNAAVRLGEAAEAAAVLVDSQRLDRVAAAVALTTTAQAAGIALVSAEDVVRAALWGDAP
jgi:hypothetical protein